MIMFDEMSSSGMKVRKINLKQMTIYHFYYTEQVHAFFSYVDNIFKMLFFSWNMSSLFLFPYYR